MTTSKRKSSKPNAETPSPELATARVHDLVGAAAVALPTELRDIFDEQTYQDIRSDLESCLMTLIIRKPGHIVYVHANLTALDLGPPAEGAASATQAHGAGNATASATTRSSTQQPPAKRTAARTGKSSRRQPKGKA